MSWAKKNAMRLNASQTKETIFSPGMLQLPPVRISDIGTEQVQSAKLLEVTLSSNLTWNAYIESTVKRCNQMMYLLYHLKRSGVPVEDLLTVYKSMIRPLLEYACPV